MDRQRAALCDLLDSLSQEQWEAETLCAGWDSGDVVAHMIVREREPLPAVGIAVKALSPLHDRRMASRKKSGRSALMRLLRKGPTPWWRYGLGAQHQVVEDWIHMQDVARGGAATAEGAALPTSDGTEDPEVDKQLWHGITRFAPLTLRNVKTAGVVSLTDGSRSHVYKVGGPMAVPSNDAEPDLTIQGPVGELLLFATGRKAARIEHKGDEDLWDAVTQKKRRI